METIDRGSNAEDGRRRNLQRRGAGAIFNDGAPARCGAIAAQTFGSRLSANLAQVMTESIRIPEAHFRSMLPRSGEQATIVSNPRADHRTP